MAQRMNDAARAYILSQWLGTIRQSARHPAAEAEAPALFAKLRLQSLPARAQGLLDLIPQPH